MRRIGILVILMLAMLPCRGQVVVEWTDTLAISDTSQAHNAIDADDTLLLQDVVLQHDSSWIQDSLRLQDSLRFFRSQVDVLNRQNDSALVWMATMRPRMPSHSI